jgi:hypothetical protein
MSTNGLVQGRLQFCVMEGGCADTAKDDAGCTRPDALFFRAQVLAIVRHFFEISCQIGRLPSILGREFFRARVSHHAIPSFEDQAVFVHDVEQALARLRPQDAEIISLVGLYQYSLDEVAKLLGRSRTAVSEHFADSVDRLAEIFLESGLLREDRPDRRLQHFDPEESPHCMAQLPPKKPSASVPVGEIEGAAAGGARYSFIAHHRVV